MKSKPKSQHFTSGGKPDGGQAFGPGFAIAWQRGALVGDVPREECATIAHAFIEGAGDPHDMPSSAAMQVPCRRAQNGAFVEDIIAIAKDRLEHYQDTEFECPENAGAIRCLEAALGYLSDRQTKRQERNVAGTHTP